MAKILPRRPRWDHYQVLAQTLLIYQHRHAMCMILASNTWMSNDAHKVAWKPMSMMCRWDACTTKGYLIPVTKFTTTFKLTLNTSDTMRDGLMNLLATPEAPDKNQSQSDHQTSFSFRIVRWGRQKKLYSNTYCMSPCNNQLIHTGAIKEHTSVMVNYRPMGTS